MATIHYARLDEYWRKEEKYAFLEEHGHVGAVAWQTITPDKRHTWLTEGMQDEFETFLPIGTQETKSGEAANSIFTNYSRGAETTRDAWVYNFSPKNLEMQINRFINTYNLEVERWQRRADTKIHLDDFVSYDDSQIKWSSRLKECLLSGQKAKFSSEKIRSTLYRPFMHQVLFFDNVLNHRQGQWPNIFPVTQSENCVICLTDKGSEKPFMSLISNQIVDLHLVGAGASTQCFPFYTYAEDGSNRRENITDWALAQFRARYPQGNSALPTPHSALEKWDIFHYVYAILHHPDYRAKYAANLRRELPRIPFVEDFWGFAQAGARLAELHVHYEQQPEYRLDFIENADKPLNWRVERMKLNKDKTSLVYNDFLTLAGIPPQVYDYKLGNRSALEWVIDQYQVSTDKRSGIVNDPNNPADPQAIVRLIGQVVTVSVETVRLVQQLPPLAILKQDCYTY
ncbi:MAG: type ISP restriction/modification enzyme [Caldilineaceae bacterium]